MPRLHSTAERPSGRSARLAGWRLWTVRLALVVGGPALFFGVLEGGLRVCGYGARTTFFVKTADGAHFTTNAAFCAQFFPADSGIEPWPALLPARKPAGTLRIFVLGESAAMGTPDPSFGFARILELMLRRAYPARRFEVVNAAVRGINSHIILPIARECAEHEPDLFIIYAGNNEMTGLYAPEPGMLNLTPHRRLLRLATRVKMTKSAQLLRSLARGLGPAPAEARQDMPFFRERRIAADDPRRADIAENFRANLRDICGVALASRAHAVLSTVAVNLRDCPPLASLHRADLSPADAVRWEARYAEGVAAETSGALELAADRYRAAAALDDHFAELHFRLARCTAGEGSAAYAAARDWDALPFRADARINDAVRAVARGFDGSALALADAERVFAESAAGAPGDALFYEHVHLRFEGDDLLARTLFPSVVAGLGLAASDAVLPSPAECRAALGLSDWDTLDMDAAIAQLTGSPPFLDQLDHAARQARAAGAVQERVRHFTPEDRRRAAEACATAVKTNPDDWQLHFILGRTLYAFGNFAAAVPHLEFAVRAAPDFALPRLLLAECRRKVSH